MTELHWLPTLPDWRQRLRALPADPATAWDNAVALANARLNFVLTNALDETVRRVLPNGPETLATKKVRLAVLGSSTLTHLLPAIRVAGLRRGIWIDTYENDYGQYLQELSDAGLGAARVQADRGPAGAGRLPPDRRRHRRHGRRHGATRRWTKCKIAIREVWRLAREAFRCPILQQAALPVHLPVLGNNEHRLPGSRAWFVTRLNAAIRAMAEAEGVDILAVDDRAARDGIGKWHDPGAVAPLQAGGLADRRADVRRPGGPLAGGEARTVVQVPGAGPGQHRLGRRDRR